jgi:hypothetical protein
MTKVQIQYRKTLNRFNTKDSYTGNITHNAESTTDKIECWVVGIAIGFMGGITGVKKLGTGDLKP